MFLSTIFVATFLLSHPAAFWRLHGKVFKLGYHDFANRERVTALLRFNASTLADAEALITRLIDSNSAGAGDMAAQR